jgi:hypothetical protein
VVFFITIGISTPMLPSVRLRLGRGSFDIFLLLFLVYTALLEAVAA